MVAPAVPMVVLGSFTVVCVALFVGGCVIYSNWYPLFVAIPALLACFCAYMFTATSEEGGCSGGFISNDTWLFYTVMMVTSMIAMPLMFFHLGMLGGGALGMHLGGDVVMAAGFIIYMWLQKKIDDGY